MADHQIIGQEAIRRELTHLVLKGRLPHAVLLHGPRSNGKLAMAMWLARFLMCREATDKGACGLCGDCFKTFKNIHPDIHFVYPIYAGEKGKSGSLAFVDAWRAALDESWYFDIDEWMDRIGGSAKNPNISVHQCNEIIRSLSLKAYEGGKKIVIVWMAEYLLQNGNRILKLIEEPPEDSYLIFVSEDVDSILPTIRSRCLELYMGRLSVRHLSSYLLERGLCERAHDAEWVARMSEGRLNEAIRWCQNAVHSDVKKLWVDWLRFGFRWQNDKYFQWVSDFGKLNKLDQRLFFRYGLIFMSSLLRAKVFGVGGAKEGDKVSDFLVQKLDMDQLSSLVCLLEGCLYGIVRNANSMMVMMDAGIKMKRIVQNKKSVSYGM